MDRLPELVVHLVTFVTLTIACGGLGFILVTAFFENVVSKRWSEYVIITISVGLALILLVVIGLSAFNIPLTQLNLYIVFLFLGGLCILRILNKKWKVAVRFKFLSRQDLEEILLLGFLFASLLFIRVVQLKEVFVPNWFDGLVHTSLLQKFIFEEKIPIDRIYHTGFHAIALTIYQFWGMTIPQTVLLLGQWLSVICGITFYSFVRRFTRHVLVAFLSSVAYSLLLFFPSHLISWSRYPFLLGLTLLPAVILTSMDWITNDKGNYFLALILIISLFISHYGSFLIWFSFVIIHLVYKIRWRCNKQNLLTDGKSILNRSFLLVTPLLFIVSPKVINLWGRRDIIEKMLLRVNDPDFGIDTLNVMNLVLDNNFLFVLIWVLVILWLFLRGKKILSITFAWPLTILFLTWFQYYFLGVSITNYTNFLIFCSMPFAISFGLLFFRLWLSIMKVISNWFAPEVDHIIKRRINILLIIAIIPGMFTNFKFISPETIIFFEEDKLAMEWIKDNTPPDSVFLIRSTLWGEGTFMPSDGGGWIDLMTGRHTVYPEAIGELYDVCVFAGKKEAKYIYFGRQSGDNLFDLRLSDLDEKSYRTVYETQNVKIVYLLC